MRRLRTLFGSPVVFRLPGLRVALLAAFGAVAFVVVAFAAAFAPGFGAGVAFVGCVRLRGCLPLHRLSDVCRWPC